MADNPTEKTLAELGVGNPQGVEDRFAEVRARFDEQIVTHGEKFDWQPMQVSWLGRNGVLTAISEKWLKPAAPALRPTVGRCFNELRQHVAQAIEALRRDAESAAEQAALARERVDLSLPGVIRPIGSRHLLRQTFAEIERIFLSLGFSVVEGPEIETPYYNFEALNIPEHHPARDTMDTFYMETP